MKFLQTKTICPILTQKWLLARLWEDVYTHRHTRTHTHTRLTHRLSKLHLLSVQHSSKHDLTLSLLKYAHLLKFLIMWFHDQHGLKEWILHVLIGRAGQRVSSPLQLWRFLRFQSAFLLQCQFLFADVSLAPGSSRETSSETSGCFHWRAVFVPWGASHLNKHQRKYLGADLCQKGIPPPPPKSRHNHHGKQVDLVILQLLVIG